MHSDRVVCFPCRIRAGAYGAGGAALGALAMGPAGLVIGAKAGAAAALAGSLLGYVHTSSSSFR